MEFMHQQTFNFTIESTSLDICSQFAQVGQLLSRDYLQLMKELHCQVPLTFLNVTCLKGRWKHGEIVVVPVGATNVGSIIVDFDKV